MTTLYIKHTHTFKFLILKSFLLTVMVLLGSLTGDVLRCIINAVCEYTTGQGLHVNC